jgi:hypothetical protein
MGRKLFRLWFRNKWLFVLLQMVFMLGALGAAFGCQWGEMYDAAIQATGFDYVTLRKDKWVAGKIQLYLRRYNLTLTHAQVIASLSDPEIRYWCAEIAKDRAQRARIPDVELLRGRPYVAI